MFDWRDVYTILIEECGAVPNEESAADFIRSMLNGHREYRFQGSLGFGGKLHFNGRRCWVSCYSEDRNEARAEMIVRANARLPDLYKRRSTP